jgi:hypothetical protein
LPFLHWYCYACHVSVIVFLTLVLLILLHRSCYPSYIVLLLLSHWSYYFYRIDVGTLFTLVFHAQGPTGSIFIVFFYNVVVDFVSLVSLVSPPLSYTM